MPRLQTLSEQILATPMCDLPYRDCPLDIFKMLKALGLESNGADSLFLAASRLAACRPQAADIDEALHSLIKESQLIQSEVSRKLLSENVPMPTFITESLSEHSSFSIVTPSADERCLSPAESLATHLYTLTYTVGR